MTVLSGTTDLSDYTSRSVTIEVVGGCYQIGRAATYRMTVPCSRLSQTIQQIHRRGGKISQVILASADKGSNREFVQSLSHPTESNVQALPQPVEEAESNHFSDRNLTTVESAPVLVTESLLQSSKPRRSKPTVDAQPQAKSAKAKSTAKSTKGTQGQRSKRKSKS